MYTVMKTFELILLLAVHIICTNTWCPNIYTFQYVLRKKFRIPQIILR